MGRLDGGALISGGARGQGATEAKLLHVKGPGWSLAICWTMPADKSRPTSERRVIEAATTPGRDQR